MKRAAPTRSGYLEVPEDDVRVYWDYFGSGERDTVVFMNGLGMLTESWYTSVPRVHPELDVLLFDYPGQGRSTRNDAPRSIPRLCEYLARILDTLGIEAVHTQGVSYGGFVTADFGRLFPDRLITQTLSGIQLSRTHSFAMYQALSLAFYQHGEAGFDLYVRYLYEKIFSETFLEVIHTKVDRMRQSFYDNYRCDVRSLARLTEAQDDFFDGASRHREGYRAVRAPTLVIAGEHDRAIPVWAQRELTEIYPVCRWVELPGCGHMTYLEQPEAFWGHLRRLVHARSIDYPAPATA